MSELFSRAYRLVVGDREIDATTGVGSTGLRIGFAIARDETRVPNSCEIRCYNLARTTREALAKSATVTVSLEAGYVGSVGQLFLGDLRTVRTHREGPDLITTVSGGDGEAALRTARIAKTFPAGTPVSTVLQGLATALGVDRGNVADASRILTGRKLARAQTLHGVVYDELEDFCRSNGLRWSVQDSALQIRSGDEPVRGTLAPLLRADSGLIGEPEVQTKGKAQTGRAGQRVVSFSALLRADIIPGQPVALESEAFSGPVVVVETTHQGDSHQGAWQVDAVGRPY